MVCMETEISNSEYRQWRVEEFERKNSEDASIEVVLGLYEHYDCLGRFLFQWAGLQLASPWVGQPVH